MSASFLVAYRLRFGGNRKFSIDAISFFYYYFVVRRQIIQNDVQPVYQCLPAFMEKRKLARSFEMSASVSMVGKHFRIQEIYI